jgi:hypothetical protein
VLKQTLNKLFVIVIINTKFLFNLQGSVFHFAIGSLHVLIYNWISLTTWRYGIRDTKTDSKLVPHAT